MSYRNHRINYKQLLSITKLGVMKKDKKRRN